jgi:hypothetical protein
VGCEDGRWMELAQEHTQWWDLVLPGLKIFGFCYRWYADARQLIIMRKLPKSLCHDEAVANIFMKRRIPRKLKLVKRVRVLCNLPLAGHLVSSHLCHDDDKMNGYRQWRDHLYCLLADIISENLWTYFHIILSCKVHGKHNWVDFFWFMYVRCILSFIESVRNTGIYRSAALVLILWRISSRNRCDVR